ncbi:unnamed protein product [Ilex paraguariensis]|uniref:Uncharacterized protein n=1 Tax=Ilex paraguariensis TaxID=185542 RepID=A0ABC8SMF3_9AQUA
MYSSFTSWSSATAYIPLCFPSHQNSVFNFSSYAPIPYHHHGRRRIRTAFPVKFSHTIPQTHLRIPIKPDSFRFISSSREKVDKGKDPSAYNHENVLKVIAKPILYTFFCIVVGLCPIGGLKVPAFAATLVASETIQRPKGKEKEEGVIQNGHEYSDCTRRLLETVSGLLRTVGEVRSNNGDVKNVEAALKEVKMKKKELQEEIMSELYAELRVLKGEKEGLAKRSDEILDMVLKGKREEESLLRKGSAEEGVKERIAKLEEEMSEGEKVYNLIWERIGEIEDQILRKETVALSIGVRELSFIERECEALVERFTRDLRTQSIDSVSKSSVSKHSRFDIQEELQTAQRQFWEQIILPSVLENEDIGHPFDQGSLVSAQRIKEALQGSRDMQRNLEAGIKKNMKRFGEEKRYVVNAPVDEVVKGFPEVELKWMFGHKEVVVPKAVGLHLFNGWKKWREQATTDLKKKLLEDVELGKKYVAQRQERILLDRDRVASKTCYNEERKRWEMDPIAVPYAVSRKLVENARIRHDWAVMYIALKGDDLEYYVDLKECEMVFEDFGGVDGLYLRMLASGIPIAVQLMWIPFSELDLRQQLLLIIRLTHKCLTGLWNTRIVSYAREWVVEKVKNVNDDIMMMIVFPVVEFIIPYPVRMQLGMAWPEYIDQSVGSTWYLKWQSEAEMSFKSRKTDEFQCLCLLPGDLFLFEVQ